MWSDNFVQCCKQFLIISFIIFCLAFVHCTRTKVKKEIARLSVVHTSSKHLFFHQQKFQKWNRNKFNSIFKLNKYFAVVCVWKLKATKIILSLVTLIYRSFTVFGRTTKPYQFLFFFFCCLSTVSFMHLIANQSKLKSIEAISAAPIHIRKFNEIQYIIWLRV